MKKYPIRLNITLTEDLHDFAKKRSDELTKSISAYLRGLVIIDRAESDSDRLRMAVTKRLSDEGITGKNGRGESQNILKIVKEEENKIYEEKND